jgi:hypothetical protein
LAIASSSTASGWVAANVAVRSSTFVDSGLGKHYRVRWDDGHETTFFPSSDAIVDHGGVPVIGNR